MNALYAGDICRLLISPFQKVIKKKRRRRRLFQPGFNMIASPRRVGELCITITITDTIGLEFETCVVWLVLCGVLFVLYMLREQSVDGRCKVCSSMGF